MRPELQLILTSAKLNPTSKDFNFINQLILEIEDWDFFINTIIERGFAPMFYKKLPFISAEIPEHIKQLLRKTYYTTINRNITFYSALNEFSLAFKNSEIAFIPLKGIFVAEWLYGDIGLRQMSDIDLLIKEEDGDKAVSIMEEIGYIISPFEIIVSETADKITRSIIDKDEAAHLQPMLKGILSVELHTKLQYKHEEYKQDTQEIWDTSRVVSLNGNNVRVLDFYQQIIHICLHLHRHTGSHLQFTCYSDILVFLEKFKDEINWRVLIDTCVKNGYEVPVFRYMLLAHEYMGAPLPSNIIDQYSYTVTDIDRDWFYKHLTGFNIFEMPVESAVPAHFQNIKHINKPLLKVRYMWEVVFPGKEFMLQKYSIKQPRLFWLWYPYRYYCGLKGFWYVVTKNNTVKKQK